MKLLVLGGLKKFSSSLVNFAKKNPQIEIIYYGSFFDLEKLEFDFKENVEYKNICFISSFLNFQDIKYDFSDVDFILDLSLSSRSIGLSSDFAFKYHKPLLLAFYEKNEYKFYFQNLGLFFKDYKPFFRMNAHLDLPNLNFAVVWDVLDKCFIYKEKQNILFEKNSQKEIKTKSIIDNNDLKFILGEKGDFLSTSCGKDSSALSAIEDRKWDLLQLSEKLNPYIENKKYSRLFLKFFYKNVQVTLYRQGRITVNNSQNEVCLMAYSILVGS